MSEKIMFSTHLSNRDEYIRRYISAGYSPEEARQQTKLKYEALLDEADKKRKTADEEKKEHYEKEYCSLFCICMSLN